LSSILKIGLIICITIFNFSSVNAETYTRPLQDSIVQQPSDKASQLLANKQYDELLAFCKAQITKLLGQTQKDSLEIAMLYKYKNKGYYQQGNYLESIKSAKKGIAFCNNTEEGRLLKGKLYSDKASSETYCSKDKSTFNSTLNAIKYLRSVKDPDYDYLITSYRYLSEQCAYHGNFDDAKMYLRQAEELYHNNKEAVDLRVTDASGYVYKYDIILDYSRTYQLYKYGKTTADSLLIEQTLRNFEAYNKQSNFHKKRDGVYYTTALSHIGDWYCSRKSEAETSKEDLEKASQYINRSIDLMENKGYGGVILSTKYNRVKLLVRTNELEAAESQINELLDALSQSDRRRPFFLAQKGLIKAKQKQKDSAIATFLNAIRKVHSDSMQLKRSLDNFKPSGVFGHTNLLLRISEELHKYFPKDSMAQQMVAKLYSLAFYQFENSYDKRKFNKTQETFLKKIIQGILRTKKLGYNKDIKHIDLLNRFENIQNQLAWQKFNQNRQIDNFPELDSLQFRNYELRSQIADLKYKEEISQADSLQTLLSQTEKLTKEMFPNLELFDESNFRVADLMQQLQPHQMVIKYIVFDDEIAIFTISKATVDVVLKPWSELDKKKVETFMTKLKAKACDTELAHELADNLLPEIDKAVTHIIINPDEILNKLAFEVLMQDDTNLVENLRVSYTSNLVFVFPSVFQEQHTKELAIYAPEYPRSASVLQVRSKPSFLEGALKESELISQMFSSSLYNGKQLTKQDFIETASQYKLLHLAMHADVDPALSGISRLLFSDASSQADDLYLEELYGLNLNADLAVLSACNTGVDESNKGSDIESFQRAFTFAGVPATIASLWEVPDLPTKEIMVGFYSNLKKGQTKSEALKNAKLSFLETHKGTKLAQPYYWAGFVLYGLDEPVSSTMNFWYWWVIAVALLFIGLMLYNRQRNKVEA